VLRSALFILGRLVGFEGTTKLSSLTGVERKIREGEGRMFEDENG